MLSKWLFIINNPSALKTLFFMSLANSERPTKHKTSTHLIRNFRDFRDSFIKHLEILEFICFLEIQRSETFLKFQTLSYSILKVRKR